MSVFRAYDIRGVYPTEISESLAESLGKAFGSSFSSPPTIVVGGDVRTSTPALKASVIAGLVSTGAKVIDVGMVTTPMVYFAVPHFQADGGVAVTASHNPKDYNGFKLIGTGGMALSWDHGIKEIKDVMDAGQFREGTGTVEQRPIDDAYIAHLTHYIKAPPRKVVVDAANGACSLIAPRVFEALGCEVIPLFCDPDGTFPNHEADPVKKRNLVHLQEKVRETGADLGVSYDCDGDRLGVVNEHGEIVENNVLFSLMVKDLLKHTPAASIVYEVVMSQIVEDTIKREGGTPVLSKVGHSFIQESLAQHNAPLGGENSGHYYFQENRWHDDGIFASLKVLEVIRDAPLSQRTQEIPTYMTSDEFRPFCADEEKFSVVSSLQEELKQAGFSVDTIDGARVVTDTGRFIIRVSNTQPCLVVRWEATTPETFKQLESTVTETLGRHNISLT